MTGSALPQSRRLNWGLVVFVIAVCPLAACVAVYQPPVAVIIVITGSMLAVSPAFSWLRIKVERPKSAPPAVELVAIPVLLEGRLLLGPNLVTLALLALVLYLLMAVPVRATKPSPFAVVSVIIVLVLPYSRPFNESLRAAALIPALCVIVIALAARRRDLHTAVTSLIDGIGLYLLLNVLGYLAGVVSPAAAERIGGLESSGGGLRIIFPLATSLSAPAALAAIYIAAAIICFERCSISRLLARIAALACGVFILYATDTRAALITAAVIALLSIVSTRVLARLALPTAIVSVAFAVIFAMIQPAVGTVLNGLLSLVPGLSRGGEASDLTLNGRSVIWDRSLAFWGNSTSSVQQLIGYGLRGQQQSGASSQYSATLSGVSADPATASTHNSYLQQLYDGGLIGALVFVGLLLWAVRRYSVLLRARTASTQLALPAIVAAVATGMTEVSTAPGYGQAPTFVALAFVLFASAHERLTKQTLTVRKAGTAAAYAMRP
jgi:O-antigen ligase